MRSMVDALARELFGKSIALPRFPVTPEIRGLGMSDWDGYAGMLAKKLSYTNTFYHCEPKFDITNIDERDVGRYDFVLSSDVFEHIPLRDFDTAFQNTRRLLSPDGVFVFTIPYFPIPQTVEHFPRLHDFHIREEEGKRVLHNVTEDGEREVFTDLTFHGGEGSTLEMRICNEQDVLNRLARAGFSRVSVYREKVKRFGIMWPIDFSLPMMARP
jgi:SAM-dependent methyltransferase